MVFMGVSNTPSPRYGHKRELVPQFHRPPDGVWAECFRLECEQSPAIDWYGADFARCDAGDETPVIDALQAATAAADRRFIAHLRATDTLAASVVVATEIISKQSVGADGPYMLPIGPPRRIY